MNQLLRKDKEENAKSGLQLNIKTTVMYREEWHIFYVDNKYIDIVTDFIYLGSVNNTNGDHSQGIRRLKVGSTAMKELGNTLGDVSLEIQSQTINTK